MFSVLTSIREVYTNDLAPLLTGLIPGLRVPRLLKILKQLESSIFLN